MSLEERLEATRQRARERLPAEVCDALERMVRHLEAVDLLAASPRAGDRLPEFELPNAEGRLVGSHELLERGPLVVSFFRGEWCPYCSLEMQALQAALPEIERCGATLVGITPDAGAALAADQHKYGLSYQLLNDADNGVALLFGLAFRLPDELRREYLRRGIDLSARHGNEAWLLPVPATYVVDPSGVIRHAQLDPDFRRRMEPNAIIRLLQEIVAERSAGDRGATEGARAHHADESIERR